MASFFLFKQTYSSQFFPIGAVYRGEGIIHFRQIVGVDGQTHHEYENGGQNGAESKASLERQHLFHPSGPANQNVSLGSDPEHEQTLRAMGEQFHRELRCRDVYCVVLQVQTNLVLDRPKRYVVHHETERVRSREGEPQKVQLCFTWQEYFVHFKTSATH